MKALIIILFLSVTLAVNAQVTEKGKIKIEELPGVIIKRVGTDFSIYIPDNNPDQKVKMVEEKFIAYDLGKDAEGYEEYLVVMEVKNGSLTATYNEQGKLVRVVEQFKNVVLPGEVIYSIYRTYPGWTIVNDSFVYTQEDGDIIKKQYNVKIKKDKETIKLLVRPNGEILKAK
ncbi:hypothetical protein IWX83_001602 [Flavobacterium sp. CG_9.1]|uniref:Intein N-terminal splicing region n=1 Tax=Flavobacterium xanthum TaxID=69322 RepID=A0A1M7EWY9_9FLAO|nr:MULTISPECIES: hypothetical protein [Flavobacterium]MBG6061812.1 hypothetical protein [Flavobacterium sp. CG_9.1]SHL96048.1 hypothetical protein SAMN05443669_101858 [Flavobacterium xanthum]